MDTGLESDGFRWSLDPADACWSLHPREAGAPAIKGAHTRVEYRLGGRQFRALENWGDPQVSEVQRLESPHGELQAVQVVVGPDVNGLQFSLGFAVSGADAKFFCWMRVDHQGAHPVEIDRLDLLDGTPTWQEMGEPAFFSNGWGSWNYTGAYGAQDRFRRTRLGPFTAPMRVNPGTPQPRQRGHFASDMFGVLGNRRTRRGLLVGFISQHHHFGSLKVSLGASQPYLRLWANGDGARLDPGCSITTDWACIQALNVDSIDPLAPYLQAVARQVPPREIAAHAPVGWCSWYQFFQDIDHQTIQSNVAAVAALGDDLPLDIIQIDDGFETRVGDWFSFTKGFPDGLSPLACEIKAEGFTPGLWLAPYILDRKSRVAKEHPDWLLRGRFNQPVNAGFIWNRFTTALDLTHPDALEYTKQVVHLAVHDWGYPYLKLDFLYAAALAGNYRDPTLTRAQVLRIGLEALREAAGEDAFLLGCGCPLGSALGLVDAMRIGADVAPTWLPEYPLIGPVFRPEPDVPSTRNAIQNVLTRLPLHKRWWANDPDCLLLRPETKLSLAEVHSLATVIALSDGMLLLSDDLLGLPQERLRIAQALLPLIGKPAQVLDWFDSATPKRLRLDLENATGTWSLLAIFNWGDYPDDAVYPLDAYGLAAGEAYIARDFWNGERCLVTDGMLHPGRIPVHGVSLLAVRRYEPDEPQYLGGNLHISQGLEVRRWEWDAHSGALAFELERPGRARGIIEVGLPRVLKSIVGDGRPLTWSVSSDSCYRIAVDFQRHTKIQIRY